MLFYLVARDYVLSTQDSLFFSPVALIDARFDVECHTISYSCVQKCELIGGVRDVIPLLEAVLVV